MSTNTDANTKRVKQAWSTLVFVYGVIGVLMAIVGWYSGILNLFYPAIGFSISGDVEAESFPIIPNKGKAKYMDVTLHYVLAKNRTVNIRNCTAIVTWTSSDEPGHIESRRFDVTGTAEKVRAPDFHFRAPIYMEGENANLLVSCDDTRTDTKSFNFGEART
jgi:hypothetical protein